jgi:hypothetical protein
MNARTFLLYLSILATWRFLGWEFAWGLFAMVVLICFANLKRAMFEIPGALKAILSALRGDEDEEEKLADVLESHLLRLETSRGTIVIRCTNDGWYVKAKGVPTTHCPRDIGASIILDDPS